MGSFPASLSSLCLDINQHLNCACPDPLDFLLCLKILYLLSSFIHISNMGPDCFLGPNFKTLVVLSFCFTCRSSLQLYSLLFLVLFIQVLIKWSPSLKKREREINKKSRPRQYSGSQLCLSYYHILRFSGRKGTLRNSRMGGAAFLYDLIWKIKSLGKYNLFRLSRPCCANLQSGSTLWRSKNIYFILWGIKAFNECIIKTKKCIQL